MKILFVTLEQSARENLKEAKGETEEAPVRRADRCKPERVHALGMGHGPRSRFVDDLGPAHRFEPPCGLCLGAQRGAADDMAGHDLSDRYGLCQNGVAAGWGHEMPAARRAVAVGDHEECIVIGQGAALMAERAHATRAGEALFSVG